MTLHIISLLHARFHSDSPFVIVENKKKKWLSFDWETSPQHNLNHCYHLIWKTPNLGLG